MPVLETIHAEVQYTLLPNQNFGFYSLWGIEFPFYMISLKRRKVQIKPMIPLFLKLDQICYEQLLTGCISLRFQHTTILPDLLRVVADIHTCFVVTAFTCQRGRGKGCQSKDATSSNIEVGICNCVQLWAENGHVSQARPVMVLVGEFIQKLDKRS